MSNIYIDEITPCEFCDFGLNDGFSEPCNICDDYSLFEHKFREKFLTDVYQIDQQTKDKYWRDKKIKGITEKINDTCFDLMKKNDDLAIQLKRFDTSDTITFLIDMKLKNKVLNNRFCVEDDIILSGMYKLKIEEELIAYRSGGKDV